VGEHLLEVGVGLLQLGVEVARVEEVALLVVRELPGDVVVSPTLMAWAKPNSFSPETSWL
jgi:hypothetical protein